MTKEETKIQMELLKLIQERLTKEIGVILAAYCDKGDHCFVKIWKSLKGNGELLLAVGYLCLWCSIRQSLKTGDNRCPVCNELLEVYPNIGIEDIRICSSCDFSSSDSEIVGVPARKISRGDIIEYK